MDILITIEGDKVVQEKFMLMGKRAVNARPAMQAIALYLLEAQDMIFAAQGARGGHAPWKPITEQWAERKARLGLDPRILHATLALRDSMSNLEDPNQFLKITNRSVTLASELPYAERQNRERPFAFVTPADRAEMR